MAPEIALVWIYEFLTVFIPRSRTPLRADKSHCMLIAPTYSDQRWTVSISSELPETVRRASDADSTISGSASDIYLALWNRASLDHLKIEGDRSAIDMLRDSVHIRWG
jgi:hypothetical protein